MVMQAEPFEIAVQIRPDDVDGMGRVTMCVGGGMGAAGIFEVYGS